MKYSLVLAARAATIISDTLYHIDPGEESHGINRTRPALFFTISLCLGFYPLLICWQNIDWCWGVSEYSPVSVSRAPVSVTRVSRRHRPAARPPPAQSQAISGVDQL